MTNANSARTNRARRRRSDPAETPMGLYVAALSGGTGHTSEQVLQAALSQFTSPRVEVVHFPRVRSARAAREIVRGVDRRSGVIVHTLVDPKIRAAVAQESQRRLVPAIDVLGPILTVLSDRLGTKPRNEAGLLYALHKEQFDRLDAVDYTLAHDDGAGLETLKMADVVLVGVSRISKSVTCFYLAYRGIRAANVPLILGCPPPAELLALPREKVIGLTMQPERLRHVRTMRLKTMGAARLERYADESAAELRYAEELMTRHRWRRIDVSYTAVEEVALHVIEVLGPSSEDRGHFGRSSAP